MDRMTRGVLELDDGHPVGVSWAGRGIPLVLLHGFGAEAIVYAQTVARLTTLGFRVIAVDAPGHGETPLRRERRELEDWADLVVEVLDHLGVRRAMFLGHSMGGRLAAEVVARTGDRALALVLVDAILGEPWDRRRDRVLRFPPTLPAFGAAFLYDSAQTAPPLRDPEQARKLLRLSLPMIGRRLRRPHVTFGAARAVLRAGSSVPLLSRVSDTGVPTVVLHGERDLVVPLDAGRDTAARVGARLVVVRSARHSWPLNCPETLPLIMEELLADSVGEAVIEAARAAGVRREQPTIDELEDALYAPDAAARRLPRVRRLVLPEERLPRFDWAIEHPRPRVLRVTA